MATDTDRLESLGNLLRRAQQIHWRLWNANVSATVTSPQSSLLSVLASNPDIDQSTAARLAHLERSTGAELIDRMCRQGIIARKRNPSDRRYYLLRLTPRGEELRESIRPKVFALQDQLMELVDPELRVPLQQGLKQLIAEGERILDVDAANNPSSRRE